MRVRDTLLFSRMMLVMLCLGLLTACQRDEEVAERGLGFEQFKPVYNRYIQKWLKQQQAELAEAMKKSQQELSEAQDAAAQKVRKDALDDIKRELGVVEFRLGLGDYFAEKKLGHAEGSGLGRGHG